MEVERLSRAAHGIVCEVSMPLNLRGACELESKKPTMRGIEATRGVAIRSGEANPCHRLGQMPRQQTKGIIARAGKAQIAGRCGELSREKVIAHLSHRTVAGGFERGQMHIENGAPARRGGDARSSLMCGFRRCATGHAVRARLRLSRELVARLLSARGRPLAHQRMCDAHGSRRGLYSTALAPGLGHMSRC